MNRGKKPFRGLLEPQDEMRPPFPLFSKGTHPAPPGGKDRNFAGGKEPHNCDQEENAQNLDPEGIHQARFGERTLLFAVIKLFPH
jgi:hypothetical protein